MITKRSMPVGRHRVKIIVRGSRATRNDYWDCLINGRVRGVAWWLYRPASPGAVRGFTCGRRGLAGRTRLKCAWNNDAHQSRYHVPITQTHEGAQTG